MKCQITVAQYNDIVIRKKCAPKLNSFKKYLFFEIFFDFYFNFFNVLTRS